MSIFGRREVQVVVDDTSFQQIKAEITELVEKINLAIEKLDLAKTEVDTARKELDKVIARLKAAQRKNPP